MSKPVKIGPRVDPDVYERFKQWVAEKHGKTRGVTGDELEKAMLAHMDDSPEREMVENQREMMHRLEDLEGLLRESDNTHTHGDPDVIIEQKIREKFAENDSGVLREDALKEILRRFHPKIKTLDDRTWDKRRDALMRDGVVYQDPNPNSPIYWDPDGDLENLTQKVGNFGDIGDWASDHGMTFEEWEAICEEYEDDEGGEEEEREETPDESENGSKTEPADSVAAGADEEFDRLMSAEAATDGGQAEVPEE